MHERVVPDGCPRPCFRPHDGARSGGRARQACSDPPSFHRHLATLLLFAMLVPAVHSQHRVRDVDPFIGTGGHGHTFPGATLPFGMVQLSPDTRVDGWDACGGYHSGDSTIIGFSHTHLSGTGVPDYGDVLVMPGIGPLWSAPGTETQPGSGYRARFRHADESASPGYYAVRFHETGIRAELTATLRTGFHRYWFPDSAQGHIVIDLTHGLGPDNVIASELRAVGDTEIVGMRRSRGWAKDQRVFFVARFSKPFTDVEIGSRGNLRQGRSIRSAGGTVAALRFATDDRRPVLVKVGLSGVDIDGARRNLDTENPGWDFDAVRTRAAEAWERELSRIDVEGGSPSQRRIFTTALYHAMIAPNTWSDVDGRYRGMDARVHTARGWTMYTVFSLWDTFRALHPLLTIIDRARTRDFVRSLIARAKESGHLPVWELAANETWCMIGYNAVPVIVDAWMKGIRDFDSRAAFAAMTRDAMSDRSGLPLYRREGFIPGDRESESVSKTLEYAYDDWCIARFAGALGRVSDERTFDARARSWRNLFDASTGFMRPKINGDWVRPFDPAAVTNHFTEANAWQYGFFVPQDIDGLIAAHGGAAAFARKLDTLFGASSQLGGRRQADITGMIGQYAQGNEPSHHAAYLYAYAGQPWKTQALARKIMDSLYTDAPDGLCGNDDCGQMSAWYVMSAIGLYQVCPGRPEYAVGSPVFPRARIALENGRTFDVVAEGAAPSHPYIGSMTLNGAAYGRAVLSHDTLAAGGTLKFTMRASPDMRADAVGEARVVAAPFVAAPRIIADRRTFADSLIVAFVTETPGADVVVSVDGHRPFRCRAPLVLRESAALSVFAEKDGTRSGIVDASFVRHRPVGTLTLRTACSPQYTGGGDGALLDGVRGEQDFRLGAWQGYEASDLDAVIDLGTPRRLHDVALDCLQDNNAWIFFPQWVDVSYSTDGRAFTAPVRVLNPISPRRDGAILHAFRAAGPTQAYRFIRVHAKNIGVCPPWHKGAGGKAWIFADEILIR